MPQGVVIIGVQWGDEGKGKIVDYYAQEADVVARFQGGNNAGHTIVVKGKQTILHLIPSGVLHPHAQCLIGSGVVVDPLVFLSEIETLRKAGVPDLEKRVLLSDRAHLILDYHKSLDEAREGRKGGGGKIGTTKRGIGPAYEDRAARRGIRVADLYNPSRFEEMLRVNLEEKNFLLKEMYGTEPLDTTELIKRYADIGEKLRPFVRDVSNILSDAIDEKKKILYEGAQGVLLDVDYGTYPYVTSSHTLPSQSALGLGSRLPESTRFLGVLKAYSTRVGEGPFPTEILGEFGDKLRESGGEFGATTGRPRRCGWLDLVAVKYTLRISGIRHIAITKADVLSGLPELQVCTAYKINGKQVTTLPADTHLLQKAEPVFEKVKGWSGDLKKIDSARNLPQEFLDYVSKIEQYTGAKVTLVSTGAGRENVIALEKAF